MLCSYAGAGPGEECFAPFRSVLGLPDLCEWRSLVTATRASRRHTLVTTTLVTTTRGTATCVTGTCSGHGDTRVTVIHFTATNASLRHTVGHSDTLGG